MNGGYRAPLEGWFIPLQAICGAALSRAEICGHTYDQHREFGTALAECVLCEDFHIFEPIVLGEE